MDSSRAERLAHRLFRVGGTLKRMVPEQIRKNLDQRLFYAIFNLTRVTNDDYVSQEVKDRKRGRD